MSDQPMWYIHRDGTNLGPFDQATIAAALADGTFATTDPWWDEPSGSWRPLSEHPAAAVTRPTTADEPGMSAREAAPRAHAVPSAPSAGPLGTGRGAADLAAIWPQLCDLIPPLPATKGSPFICEGCGGRFNLTQVHYARQAYLCGPCNQSGAGKRVQPLAATRNPLGHLLLKHAHIWALILVLVPFLGFKMLADMMDPYKSFPPAFPPMKQAARILEQDARLKTLPWAHAIRRSLLAVAHGSAAAAFPMASDAEKDIAYIETLLALEGLGRETDAAEFIAAHPNVEPTGRKEDQVRKFYYVEARILLGAGRGDLLGNRLERIAPPPPPDPEMGAFGAVRPPAFISSPLMSGLKVYDIEIADDLYAAIACDDQVVRDLFKTVPTSLLGRLAEEQPGLAYAAGMPDAGEGAWRKAEFDRLKADGLELVDRIEAWQAVHGSQLARNTGLDEPKLGRAVDAVLKPILAGARSTNTQLNSRPDGGYAFSLRFESTRPSDITAVLRAISGTAFPFHVILTDLDISRYEQRNQATWHASFTFHAPAGAVAAATGARARHAAEFGTPPDTSADALASRLATARMLVEEMRREVSGLERKVPAGVETSFGPAHKLVDLIMASSNSLTSYRCSSHALAIRGRETGGTAALEALKTRLAPLAAERGLTPESGTQRSTRDNTEISDWWFNLAVRRS